MSAGDDDDDDDEGHVRQPLGWTADIKTLALRSRKTSPGSAPVLAV